MIIYTIKNETSIPELFTAAAGRGQYKPVCDDKADFVEPFTRAAAGL